MAASSMCWSQRKVPMIIAVASILVSAGIVLQLQPSGRSLLFWLCVLSAAAGLFWLGLAVMLGQGRWLRMLHVISTNGLVFAAFVALAEIGCRVAGVDFDSSHRDPREAYPLCFKEPTEPFGEVFFKRSGPASWTGQPLATLLRLRYSTDDAYHDEVAFTATYDRDGFRNADDLRDWDAVIVGDSFTETGYLPMDQMFTSIAATKSSLRVKNLGVCNTGPFTHVQYLREFGGATSCKVAVLAFFEGNDLDDAVIEMTDLERFGETGARPLREIGPQRSMLKAFYQVLKGQMRIPQERRYQNAIFANTIPITLQAPPMPPDPTTMAEKHKYALADALDLWKAQTERMKMSPVLLYLPMVNRAYFNLAKADDSLEADARLWTPTALPSYTKTLCLEKGIQFIDTCPALRAAAERGIPVFNPILDTHLNAAGSRIVGELLGAELRMLHDRQ